TLYGGVRFDSSRNRHRSASPRAALVWGPSPRRAWKFVYGHAFRNPSAYEMFYQATDGSYVSNLGLRPERMRTWEAAGEISVARWLDLVASLYHYRMRDLIREYELEGGGVQFRNLARARATGVEWELRARPAARLELAGGLALQRAVAGGTGEKQVNSPSAIAQCRAGIFLFRERLTIAPAFRYMSSRLSRARALIGGVPLLDLTATTNRLHRDFDVQFGVRNALDRRYWDPLSWEHRAELMPRPGRSLFVKLIWRYGG
ncbi:MAG: TonB-dependent receptor domain-containing protein, partial [Bryobacteraceae bacterium]